MKKPYIIGVTGGTASGKTFVIEALKDYFEGNVLVISQDQYYKSAPKDIEDRWERANVDEPQAFDNDLLVKHLKLLEKGENVMAPVYNYASHQQEKEKLLLEPKSLIVLEGILIFAVPQIRKLLDWKVFLEASPDVRLARRLLRDIDERGLTTNKLHADIERYINIVKPMYDKHVLPNRKHADNVYNTDKGSLEAASLVIEKLKKVLTKKYGVVVEDKALALEEYKF